MTEHKGAQPGRRIVRRRKVFYVSGYDIRGPIWYHGIYRREAARQADLSGMAVAVSGRDRRGGEIAAWTIEAETAGIATVTDYTFLRWDDIVRSHWPRGTVRLWRVMANNLREYVASGVLWRLLKTSWPTFICAFYPSAFVLVLALVTLLIGAAMGAGVAWLAGWPAWTVWPLRSVWPAPPSA